MKLCCPKCNTTITYKTGAPKFCAECGESLSGFLSDTIAPTDQSTDSITKPDTDRDAGTIVPTKKPAPLLPKFRSQQVFDNYRLIKKLGSGGMGVVWEAVELESDRHVAIKLLSLDVARDKKAVDRFVREGKLAARLSHPRSTFVYKAGEFDGQPFIVMELMPGETLKAVVDRQGKLAPNEAVDYLLDILDGLIAAHALGMVHRDIKPANCFLDLEGRAKLGDFGLSKSLTTDVSLTKTGEFMGTPLYAAPEQIRGTKADHRTDQYSLGATLFALIAGRPPFSGDAMSVTAQIVSDKPPSVREFAPNTPKSLDAIIRRSLEKRPIDRFDSLEEMRSALLPYASDITTLADLGRRLAAYFLDVIAIMILSSFLSGIGSLGLIMMRESGLGSPDLVFKQIPALLLIGGAATFATQLLYFAISESLFGFALGKYLMGLCVRDQQGNRASIWKTSLRALVLPAGFGIGLLWAWFVSYYDVLGYRNSAYPTDTLRMLITNLAQQLVIFAPGLVCALSMRKTNGYLGLHEMFSGTRTERFWKNRNELRFREIPLFASLQTDDLVTNPKEFGCYLAYGLVADTDEATVYAAQDETLHRKVWIYQWKQQGGSVAKERINVARIGRNRWLQGGTVDGTRWDAFEAVNGLPMHVLVNEHAGIPWSHSRYILRDLARELKASIGDGSLPKQTSFEQVWVDSSGQVKLLDHPITKSRASTNPNTTPANPEAGANHLLCESFKHCSVGNILPLSARDLYKKLENGQATLDQAVDKFQEITEKPGSLKWDDRLGILAITFGIEFPLYTLLNQIVVLILVAVFSLNILIALCCAWAAQLAVACLISYHWEHGSPLFKLMGIRVANLNGQPAPRWRIMLRNCFAWFPVFLVSSGWFVLTQFNQIAQTFGGQSIVGLIGLVIFFLQVGVLAGIVISILQADRGPQDFLARTMLVLE